MAPLILVDANVILEMLLPGRAHAEEVQKYLLSLQGQAAISMLTVHLVMHFGRLNKLPDDKLQEVIEGYMLLDLKALDYEWAREHEQGRDFEDALQLAVALRNGCSQLVTLDKSFIKRYAEQPITLLYPE